MAEARNRISGARQSVLILSAYQDTGGVGFALRDAFQRWAPAWSARHVRRSNNYLDYPVDIEWPGGTQSPEVAKLYRDADVIHVMEQPDILTELGPTDARIIVQHLGSFYRSDPEGVSAQCQAIGATEAASSMDLMLLPHLEYLPIPSPDMDKIAGYRKPSRASGRIRIAHAPTNRAVKQTASVIKAIGRLKARHKLTFDLIEGEPWERCLQRKARADIYVDETRLGYGLNAIECWIMGIPVISGIADRTARDLMILKFGGLPFFETTEATLEASIEALVADPVLRAEWAQRGREHVQQWHHPQAVVQRTIELYER